MTNIFLKISCLLTGYNYKVVKECSPAMSRKIYTYTIILILITALWFFIGKFFYLLYVNPYNAADPYSNLVGAFAAFMVFVIDRIILSMEKINRWSIFFRIILGACVAIIGTLVVDQCIFKGDIEIERNKVKGERIDQIVASRSTFLKEQMIDLEEERKALMLKADSLQKEVMEKPYITIKIITREKNEKNINEGSDQKQTESSTIIKDTILENPVVKILEDTRKKIASLDSLIKEKDNYFISLRETVTNEVEKSFGLIDDLKLLWKLIFDSWISTLLYLVFILTFLFIELFIVLSKWENFKNGGEDEYLEIVREKRNINRMNRARNAIKEMLN